MHSPESDHHELCDCIGEESSFDVKSDVVLKVNGGGIHRRRRRTAEEAEKEYPPPIPWLARTENLPSHMPWVMKKYYTSDGRLIIKEEKVKRHEYFHAHRSNGRLVLNLVPLDDAVEEGCKERRHAGDDDPAGNPSEVVINGQDQQIRDQTVDKTLPECYRSYNGSIGGNPCGGFGMAVPAFTPPLHT